MHGGFYDINLIIATVSLVICVIGLTIAINSRYLEKRTRLYFIAFFSVLNAYGICDLIWQLTDGHPGEGWVIAAKLSSFFEGTFSSMLMLMITAFLLDRGGIRDWYRTIVFRIVAVLWLIYFGLLVYTQFSTEIYSISADNVYQRGPWYPILLVPPVLIMAANLAALWKIRARLTRKQIIVFAAYILFPLIGMLIQMRFFGLYVIVFGTAIATMFMLSSILSEQTEQYYRQKQENAQLQIDIMLSQIQPHFLFNSLGAIRRLCQNDPEAKDAITKFAQYLRGNMDSIEQSKPIPFTTELEHTKLYVYLEQLRFGDELQVVYDLACTEFLIPTLTLQPLVENAVRYGVRKTESGTGTVTITTREQENRYEIIVVDDGPGFDPENLPADDQSHIGLANVRKRLAYISGGDLRIDSAPGKGCRVTMELPKGGVKRDADIRDR